MSQYQKSLLSILSGTQDSNIPFADLQLVLDRMGFQCRIKGDHFIYTMDGVEEIVNLQPRGGKAKPYQVKQIRQIVLNHQLGGAIHE
ncbi:MAG: type II toxin-antitoxin system HicA family toxin [Oscillospiraceae bacterium]|nr:type II toxin-antitoxin system HicA family toxin [Oscillospiraceae bacterium]